MDIFIYDVKETLPDNNTLLLNYDKKYAQTKKALMYLYNVVARGQFWRSMVLCHIV